MAKFLVAYFGLVQIAHLVALAWAAVLLILTGRIPFPAPPPPGGWSPQARHFLIGLGVADAVTALLAVAFVFGYFSSANWCVWLGMLTLTSAVCSAVVFAYGTIASGAWACHPVEYLSLAIAFTPVAVLFVLFNVWVIRGKLSACLAGWPGSNA